MAEVTTLAPLVVALAGPHELVRAQLNGYLEGSERPGHAMHQDQIKSDEVSVVFSVGAKAGAQA